MKYFVLTYDRAKSELLGVEQFTEGSPALDRRMALEKADFSQGNVEIVILLARDEEHLRQTHARYFRSTSELFDSASRLLVA